VNAAQNGTVWADGRLRDWESLSVPLMSDAVMRSAVVFDGLRADLTGDGRVRLLAGQAHARRLVRSARSLRLPLAYDAAEILRACALVAHREMTASGSRVAYVRPMALGARLTEVDHPVSLTIAAFAQDDKVPEPVRLQVSSLRRPSSDSLPPQIKAIANYQLSRLARMQAHALGYGDALLLNAHGRLAEAAGSAVLVEKDGRLLSPPAWEGALPSITVEVLESLAHAIGIPFDREPVDLTTVWSADGLALAGTLADVVDVIAVDDLDVPPGKAIAALRGAFLAALAGAGHEDLMRFAQYDRP
jgi:branched-chain amino acid aminotransferase